jgi:hypothetical protein
MEIPPPFYRPGAFCWARCRLTPAVALRTRTFAIETQHATSSVPFHRPSNFREIEPRHATEVLERLEG